MRYGIQDYNLNEEDFIIFFEKLLNGYSPRGSL